MLRLLVLPQFPQFAIGQITSDRIESVRLSNASPILFADGDVSVLGKYAGFIVALFVAMGAIVQFFNHLRETKKLRYDIEALKNALAEGQRQILVPKADDLEDAIRLQEMVRTPAQQIIGAAKKGIFYIIVLVTTIAGLGFFEMRRTTLPQASPPNDREYYILRNELEQMSWKIRELEAELSSLRAKISRIRQLGIVQTTAKTRIPVSLPAGAQPQRFVADLTFRNKNNVPSLEVNIKWVDTHSSPPLQVHEESKVVALYDGPGTIVRINEPTLRFDVLLPTAGSFTNYNPGDSDFILKIMREANDRIEIVLKPIHLDVDLSKEFP
jgi:hypothetical protein